MKLVGWLKGAKINLLLKNQDTLLNQHQYCDFKSVFLIDILIAGIAIANNLIVVTNNRRDFDRIQSLDIEDWSQFE